MREGTEGTTEGELQLRPPADLDQRADYERWRLIAALGGGIVHELANRIGMTVGFADEVVQQLPTPAVAQFERGLTAARESLSLLRTVQRLMERAPDAGAVVSLDAVLAEAIRLLQKHAVRSGLKVELGSGEAAMRVRMPWAELLQSISTAVLFAANSGSRRLSLAAIRLPNGRARACVQIRADGPMAPFAALAAALRSGGDPVPALRQAAGGPDALVVVTALLRRHGGDLRVETAGDGDRTLCLCLPERTA